MESTTDTSEVSALNGIEVTAQHLGRSSPWTIRKHIERGNIKVVRIGRRVFISEDEIRRIQRDGLPPLRTNEPREMKRLQGPARRERLSRGR